MTLDKAVERRESGPVREVGTGMREERRRGVVGSASVAGESAEERKE